MDTNRHEFLIEGNVVDEEGEEAPHPGPLPEGEGGFLAARIILVLASWPAGRRLNPALRDEDACDTMKGRLTCGSVLVSESA
jgi:hypothetical protein